MHRLTGYAMALMVAASLIATPAPANDTAMNPRISPPQPLLDEQSPVRMEYEHLVIHFGLDTSRVEVEFTFHNLSDDTVSVYAGFPDEDLLFRYLTADSDYKKMESFKWDGEESVIRDFEAWIRPGGDPPEANQELPFEVMGASRSAIDLTSLPDGEWQGDPESTVYRMFNLQFRPDETIVVGHRYLTPNGDNAMSQQFLWYTLSTGANWRGTIGETEVDVYLEDGLTAGDLCLEGTDEVWPVAIYPARELWEIVDDTHLRLILRDFEPDEEYSRIELATNPLYIEWPPKDAGAEEPATEQTDEQGDD